MTRNKNRWAVFFSFLCATALSLTLVAQDSDPIIDNRTTHLLMGEDWDGTYIRLMYDSEINDILIAYDLNGSSTGQVLLEALKLTEWKIKYLFNPEQSPEGIVSAAELSDYIDKYNYASNSGHEFFGSDRLITLHSVDNRTISRCPFDTAAYYRLSRDTDMPITLDSELEFGYGYKLASEDIAIQGFPSFDDSEPSTEPYKFQRRVMYLYQLPDPEPSNTGSCVNNQNQNYLKRYVDVRFRNILAIPGTSELVVADSQRSGLVMRLDENLTPVGLCEIEGLAIVNPFEVDSFRKETTNYQEWQDFIGTIFNRERQAQCGDIVDN